VHKLKQRDRLLQETASDEVSSPATADNGDLPAEETSPPSAATVHAGGGDDGSEQEEEEEEEDFRVLACGRDGVSLAQKLHDEFLVCKICLEDYRQPKCLDCMHTFCEQCIESHVFSETSYKKYSDYREYVYAANSHTYYYY